MCHCRLQWVTVGYSRLKWGSNYNRLQWVAVGHNGVIVGYSGIR